MGSYIFCTLKHFVAKLGDITKFNIVYMEILFLLAKSKVGLLCQRFFVVRFDSKALKTSKAGILKGFDAARSKLP